MKTKKLLSILILCSGLILGGAACSNVAKEVVNEGTDSLGTDDLSDLQDTVLANTNADDTIGDTVNANVPNTNSGTVDEVKTDESNTGNSNASSNVPEDANTNDRAEVSVTASGFSPSTVTIAVGGTVVWQNTTRGTVYVAPDNHPSHTKYRGTWDDSTAGQIGAGESFTKTFTTAGTYTYHNHLNSSRIGTVIVE